jgi:hypothetical protein
MNEEIKIESKKSNFWLYVCFVILAFNYFALFDMAFAGLKHDFKNISGELFLNALIYWYIFKKNRWNQVVGVVFGLIFYFALLLLSGVIAIKFAQ